MPLPKPLPITGFGLLGMTWRPSPTPDKQAFSAMKTAISHGATIWSSSSVYGMPPQPPTAGLHLLRRYFDNLRLDPSCHFLFCLIQDNFPKNLELVERINDFARQRGVTPAQLALAWIRAHSNSGPCGTIIPTPGATAASHVEENCTAIPLAAEEKEQLDAILKSFDVAGERQVVGMSSELWG
ncbi:uncharacterized protein BO87DRAFT_387176 [Aspergillus neoniger CBS 115656]|uniref:NADP-dependent oxidoreductase domain-containing protein n=1 Tax=Aspergillus neoniger (strain CBS 115656) TaxID=1448310 RepID=A0A318YJ17_ASPNB|nr:hypothetical protein BO87DRAFT_387176 [Aspergillus neoniger CBS 115656]PYH33747.1 hypothetical protein BO87DRAFT_387176 [Aspergillus neoniger CBS 115656]